jgi:hypothetical protein
LGKDETVKSGGCVGWAGMVQYARMSLPSTDDEGKIMREATPPPNAVVDRAVAQYNQKAITLGRAAEMAGVTRWELQHILQARGAPLIVEVPPTQELDRDLVEYLE